jgi:hypothetical protein
MKKYIQIIVALVLVVTVIGVAQGGTAWASGLPEQVKQLTHPAQPAQAVSEALLAPPPMRVEIGETGTYNIGGVCIMDVTYVGTNLADVVDAEVPIKDSSKVPFAYPENLIYPGCHVVHSKDGKVVREADPEDGTWKVCFGANPYMDQEVYYYLDDPEDGVKTWIPVPSSIENGYLCATAPFTGVYMPAGKVVQDPGNGAGSGDLFPGVVPGGSVLPPPDQITVTESGTYAVGGVCAIIIQYYVENLSDQVHVQYPTEDTVQVPFLDQPDSLFLPGCHVIHYRDAQVRPEMTPEEGDWKICFATRPGFDMTIYNYRDDLSDITPPWQALETTIEGGLACAPLADYSAVYAPAGREP